MRLSPRSLLAVLAVGALAFLVPLTSGHAADLPDAVTDVSIQQSSAPANSRVTVDLKYRLGSAAKPGDTFSLQLPAGLRSQSGAFDLRDPSGLLVATAVVRNGVVTFTVTDYVTTHDHVTGTAHLSASMNLAVVTPGQRNTFVFKSGTRTFSDQVDVGPVARNTHTAPDKYGFWTDPADQGSQTPANAIQWRIQSQRGPYGRLTVTDAAGPGQTIDCATLAVVSSTVFDPAGGLAHPVPLPRSRAATTCGPDRLAITVASLRAGEVVEVDYSTTITDQQALEFTNTATIAIPGRSRSYSWAVKHYGNYGDGIGDTPGPTAPVTTATTPVRSFEASSTSRTGPSSTSPALASTGTSHTVGLLGGGLVAVTAGASLVLLGRRRGTHAG